MRGVLAAALLLWAGAARAQILSPGPLSEAHAKLEGDERCASCHASGRQVDEPKCLGCHEALAARLRAGEGLHGTRFKGQACGNCHVEHLGKSAPLVRWPGGDAKKLDHAQTGWPLTGAHARAACAGCHTGKGYLGLKEACASCHDDPHQRRFGTTCTACHSEQSWREVRLEGLDHGLTRFALRGAHQKTACKGCHGEPPRWRGLAFAGCSDCHQDPHQGRMAGACTTCHVESSWREVTGFRAGKHPGLSLAAGHAGVACASCHDRGNDRAPSKGSACASCHPPVHEAAFGTDCKACHAPIRWLGLPERVGLEAHGRTAFPLRGAHEKVDCARCHLPSRPPRQRFRELAFDRCARCHADAHAGRLAGDCATCHDERGFAPTTFGTAAHARTRFPLAGKHEAVPCGACHGTARPRVDLSLPRSACADCHQNPHGEQFAVEMRAGGCARCHTPAGWERPAVDHSTFPLTGAHATVACAACHGDGKSYKGAPRECAACHRDPHAGQFRLAAPARACESCHDTERFAIARFDHSTYPLAGKHASAACAACHPAVPLRTGGTAVRWRLGYRACQDCHASPHGSTLLAGAGCDACHAPAGWRVAGGAGFDHARTGFPLTFAHRAAACGDCHAPGKSVTRVCAGCHEDAHQGQLGDACDGCHSAIAWSDVRVAERHRRTRLPLTGMHGLLPCTSCHLRTGDRAQTHVPSDCFACHEADWRREDIHPDHAGRGGGAPFPRQCERCHRATGWSPAVIDAATSLAALALSDEHERRFPLRAGKHRDLSCASCHVAGGPRQVSCTGCHAHAPARLAAQHRGGAPGAACLSCHPGGRPR